MPDQRETLVRKMVEEGTSDDDIRATLKSYDAQQQSAAKPPASSQALGQIKDVGIGIVKGLGSTVANIAELAANAGVIPGQARGGMFDSAMRHPLFTKAEELTTAANTPQRIGKVGEQVAELAVPAYQTGRAALSLAGKAGPLAVEAASHLPIIGRPLRILRMIGRALPEAEAVSSNAGGRLVQRSGPTTESAISDALSELRRPEPPPSVELPPGRGLPPGYEPRTSAPPLRLSPPTEPSPNAGGRLAPRQTPSLQQELSDALAEVNKPEPPRRITTPPEPKLPAGFTPRSSVPKPKAAKAAAPVATESTPAAPKRAYFLRPLSEMKGEAGMPVEPLGRPVTIDDLPASWRSRTGQALGGEQWKAGTALSADALSEIQQRGLSVPDAIDAVAKNPGLSPSQRLNLQSALIAMLGGG